MHQTSVQLDQKIVRQPAVNIISLQGLQGGGPVTQTACPGWQLAVLPGQISCQLTGEVRAQQARVQRGAGPVREFGPDQPQAGPVTAITGKKFISAFAA